MSSSSSSSSDSRSFYENPPRPHEKRFLIAICVVGFVGFLAYIKISDSVLPEYDEDEVLAQLNDYDSEFFDNFNYHLRDWITWEWRKEELRTCAQDKSRELKEKIEAHREMMKEFLGKDDVDKFRTERAEYEVLFSLRSNASHAETWNSIEIYLETIAFQRIHQIQGFLAHFLAYPYHNSSETFQSYLSFHDAEMRNFIDKNLSENLTLQAQEYWRDFKKSKIPGIRPHCLVYQSNSTLLDTSATLDRFVASIGDLNPECFPEGVRSAFDRRWTIGDYLFALCIFAFFVILCLVDVRRKSGKEGQ